MSTALIALFRLAGTDNERARCRGERGQALARVLLGSTVASGGLTLLVGVNELREMNLHRVGDDFTPPHDFALKAVADDASAFLDEIKASGVCDECLDWSAYEVEETIKKERPHTGIRGPVPGVHMLHPLYFHEDLPRSVLLRSWREIHGDLALRVHVGADMYRQHLVLRPLVKGRDPQFGGFSEFHFPSRDALLNGYFDSERGRIEIRHDIRHFIKGFPARLFAEEYDLRRTDC